MSDKCNFSAFVDRKISNKNNSIDTIMDIQHDAKINLAHIRIRLFKNLPPVKSNGKDNNIIKLKKTVQKEVTIIKQNNSNYVISLIPIKSATESGNIIFPSFV